MVRLKFGVARVSGKRDHVTDIGHSADEEHKTFEAQTKTAVGRRSEFAELEVPPQIFLR